MRATWTLILLVGCGGEPAPSPSEDAPAARGPVARECGSAMCRNYEGDEEAFAECFAEACPKRDPSWSVSVTGLEEDDQGQLVRLHLEHTPGGWGPKSGAPQDAQWTVTPSGTTASEEEVSADGALVNATDAPLDLEFLLPEPVESLHVSVSRAEDDLSSHFPAPDTELPVPAAPVTLTIRDGGGGAYRRSESLEKAFDEVLSGFGVDGVLADGAPWSERIDKDTLYVADAGHVVLAEATVASLRPRPKVEHQVGLDAPFVLVTGGMWSDRWTPTTWSVTPKNIELADGKASVDAAIHYAPSAWNGTSDEEAKDVFIGLTVWDADGTPHDAEAQPATFGPDSADAEASLEVSVDDPTRLAVGIWTDKVEPCEDARPGCKTYGYVLEGLVGGYPDMIPYYIPAYTDPGDLTLQVAGEGLTDEWTSRAVTGLKGVVEPFGGTVSQEKVEAESTANSIYVRTRPGKEKEIATLLAESLRPHWHDPGRVIVSVRDEMPENTLRVIVGAN